MRTQTLLIAIFFPALSLSGVACSTITPVDKPYDAVIVDKSKPGKTVVEFEGDCSEQVTPAAYSLSCNKNYSVKQNGKTYYFNTVQERDRFMKDFQDSAQKAAQTWAARDRSS